MDTRLGRSAPIVLSLGLWACGSGELGGTSAGGLAIVDQAPPPAVATEPYAHGLILQNGSSAVRWSLPERDPQLDWLIVDPASGILEGTPSTVVPEPAVFRVRAVDGTRSTERAFVLTVTCREGARLGCAFPAGDVCHGGIAVCQSGGLGTCTDTGAPGTDRAHCGPGCGETCDDLLTNRCDGVCSCGSTGIACGTGTQCCGEGLAAACAQTQTDAHHCGSCLTDCVATEGGRLNVVPGCEAGVCAYACVAPFGDCDRAASNGCETDTESTLAHCGACGRTCTSAPAQEAVTPTCAAGLCLHPCDAGRRNCSPGAASPDFGEDPDGCETVLGTVAQCLGCGDVCPPPAHHGLPTCGASGCGVLCDPGYSACSGQCVDLQNDRAHCGECDTACAPGARCSSGTCCSGMDC
jgi:hypothetical protein